MNTNHNNINDDLLASYLLGEATDTGRAEVETWLAASDDNRKYFEHFIAIWSESKGFSPPRAADEDAAWQRLVARTREDEGQLASTPAKGRTIPLFTRTWVRVAAMLILLAGVGSVLYKPADTNTQRMVQSGATPITDTLPDGSVVVLNKNSSLSYPESFNGDRRSVTLTGEAFFSITPDKAKPFTIDASGTEVTVVGTTFNVKTSPAKTEVIVETGIVQVAKKKKTVRLLPNEKAIVEEGREAPQTETNRDELYNYYRTGRFVCNATPLRKLAAVLSEAYSTNIAVPDAALAATPITATFNSGSLDGTLKIIAETLELSVVRKSDRILLQRTAASQ
ncbi:MAG: FecR domain-containing protein [Bacteroidota bacterium]